MNSQKELEVKLKRINQKLVRAEEKLSKNDLELKALKKERLKLKSRIRVLQKSRENLREKYRSKQKQIKGLKAKISRNGKAKWHHYSTWLVTLCVLLRIKCNCSYVNVVKILGLLNRYFHLGLKKIPCANSVQNWVSKVGLYSLTNEPTILLDQPVSLIFDESIRLGQEKLLLCLLCPWEKLKKVALSFKDVKVVYMKGSKSWKGKEIAKEITKELLDKGVNVVNILSDEGNNLKNATKLLKLPHLPDVGHCIATCLRQTFEKDTAYTMFTKLIASYLAKGVNQDLSYLCPPKLGRKARFMNQQRVVDWSKQLIGNWRRLSKVEKVFFGQLAEHRKMIATLQTCMNIAKIIAKPLKEEGLSNKVLEKIEQKLKPFKKRRGYIKTFLTKMRGYLEGYKAFLSNYPSDICIHVSSDIIESLFGKYKYKANNYALTGLTKLNLELPLYCKEEKEIIQNTHLALQSISMSRLGKWVEEYSSYNQLIRKMRFNKK